MEKKLSVKLENNADTSYQAAEILYKYEYYNQSVAICWQGIRQLASSKLELYKEHFQTTEQGLSILINQFLDELNGALLMESYSLGIMSEWDHTVEFDNKSAKRMLTIYKNLKNFLKDTVGETHGNTIHQSF